MVSPLNQRTVGEGAARVQRAWSSPAAPGGSGGPGTGAPRWPAPARGRRGRRPARGRGPGAGRTSAQPRPAVGSRRASRPTDSGLRRSAAGPRPATWCTGRAGGDLEGDRRGPRGGEGPGTTIRRASRRVRLFICCRWDRCVAGVSGRSLSEGVTSKSTRNKSKSLTCGGLNPVTESPPRRRSFPRGAGTTRRPGGW